MRDPSGQGCMTDEDDPMSAEAAYVVLLVFERWSVVFVAYFPRTLGVGYIDKTVISLRSTISSDLI